MSLPPYSFKHLMSIISSSKIATLFKFVSTVLFHRSSAILDLMEVTADYSFPDFRSPLPVPRFSNIPSKIVREWNGHLEIAGSSTGRIPQVKSAGHCSIDKLPHHTDSPRSNRAFCEEVRARRQSDLYFRPAGNEILSRPQVIENSWQYLLLRTDILQKTVVGCL